MTKMISSCRANSKWIHFSKVIKIDVLTLFLDFVMASVLLQVMLHLSLFGKRFVSIKIMEALVSISSTWQDDLGHYDRSGEYRRRAVWIKTENINHHPASSNKIEFDAMRELSPKNVAIML